MGSYAFHWGNKQETTPTWYGLFLPDGTETETLDVMQEVWSGKPPADRAPRLESFLINGLDKRQSVKLSPGSKNEVSFDLSDESELRVVWEVLPESTDIKSGGDVEKKPDPIPGLIKESDSGKVILRAPRRRGSYRLFIYAYDEGGNAATANFPFLVE